MVRTRDSAVRRFTRWGSGDDSTDGGGDAIVAGFAAGELRVLPAFERRRRSCVQRFRPA